jgi:predicted neuraminidase
VSVPFILTGLFFVLSVTLDGQISLKKVSGEMVFNGAPFAQCHTSTIVETAPQKLMVAAFGGTEEGKADVSIWLSSNEKSVWSKPERIADGVVNDSLRYPCWNPVLFKTREGKLFLFYKTGPSPREWRGMLKSSADDGLSWTSAGKFPEGILGPSKNKPVELADGTLISGSGTETKDSWKVHVERSTDSGRSWKLIPVDPETEFNMIQPAILVHPGDSLQILCRSKNNSIVQAFSADNGITWGKVTRTSLPNPDSGIDAATLKDGLFLLVYNPVIRGGEDRAKLSVAVSVDGLKWTDILILENENRGEFSYPAIIQSSDGRIHITYTYNRVNIKHVVLEEVR